MRSSSESQGQLSAVTDQNAPQGLWTETERGHSADSSAAHFQLSGYRNRNPSLWYSAGMKLLWAR